MINLNTFSTWGTVIGGFATLIGVLVTLLAIWLENRRSRLSLSSELLLQLWEKFDSDRMRAERKIAASALLEIMEKSNTDNISKLKSLDKILNFFELLGLLVKKKYLKSVQPKPYFLFGLYTIGKHHHPILTRHEKIIINCSGNMLSA